MIEDWMYPVGILAVTIIHAVFRRLDDGTHQFPDSLRYLAMGRGERFSQPFHNRWLLPFILKDDKRRWNITSTVAVILTPLTVYWYAIIIGLTHPQAAFAALLVPGLSGIFRLGMAAPVLTDQVANLLSVAAAACLLHGWLAAGIAVLLIGSCTRESIPLITAILTWNPWCLTTFLIPVTHNWLVKPNPDPRYGWRNRLKAGRQFHRDLWFNPQAMLLPWGVGLASILVKWDTLISPQTIILTVFAYGTLLLATDSLRCYQVAFPLVCCQAALVIPVGWMIPLLILHWFNPWQSPVMKGRLII